MLSAHAAFVEGRLEAMAESFDYEGLLAGQLGPVWEKAGPDDRRRAVEQLHTMMVTTTQRLWPNLEGKPLTTRVHHDKDDSYWVIVSPADSGATGENSKRFEWQYRVVRNNGVWRVAQREFILGKHRSNTRRFYPMAVNQLRKQYGRDPTLSELVANVPSLIKSTRIRTISIPSRKELQKMGSKQRNK